MTPAVQPKEVTPAAQPKEVTPVIQPKEVTPAVQPKEVTPTVQPKEVTPAAQPKEVTPVAQPKVLFYLSIFSAFSWRQHAALIRSLLIFCNELNETGQLVRYRPETVPGRCEPDIANYI